MEKEKLSYKLEVFEGPMDLLLSLISKHKLDIYDIPIVELVDQYLAYVRAMQAEDMELASEFLEMAARLVYLKTVSLLPTHEEAEQLKQELTGELLEYRDCQIMAEKLKQSATGFDLYTKEPDTIEMDFSYDLLHEPEELYRAYRLALGKGRRKLPPPVESFTFIVKKTVVSVSSKISEIMAQFGTRRRQSFSQLIAQSESRSDMVATFLAILELIKDKKVKTEGTGEDLEITLKRS